MEKVAVTRHFIRWLTIESKDSLGSVQPESLVLPWNDEEIRNDSHFHWPLSTSEQSHEAPRPFWHRELFYQRPDTSKSLAEEPGAREVHTDDLKAWKTAEAFSVPLSFASSRQADSPPPFPSPASELPRLRKVLRSLEQPRSLWGKSECWWWNLGFYASSLRSFGGLPIFCIKFLSPRNNQK